MKKLIFSTMFIAVGFFADAQTVLFSEDFESSVVTNFLNSSSGETELPTGASTCGNASRGNTSDHNSMNVDFNSTENPSYFLAANPEFPCGGYYVANLESPTIDLSGNADSLVLSLNYFISSVLTWGPVYLEVIFNNGSETDTISDEFDVSGTWTTLTYQLPTSMNNSNVNISLTIGGGEAVAIDDFEIIRYLNTAGEISNQKEFTIYPNPTQNNLFIRSLSTQLRSYEVTTLTGVLVKSEDNLMTGYHTIDLTDLRQGVYVLKTIDVDGEYHISRIRKI